MGGTKPGWNFENNGITNKDLNEIENVYYKTIRQSERELEIEKENRKW